MELFAADGHDAGGCERVTGKSGMRPAFALVKPEGVVGLLVPSGIGSDKTSADFFKGVATEGRLRALYDFENRRTRFEADPFFPDVDSRFKFGVFVAGRTPSGNDANCGFFLQAVSELVDDERRFSLAANDFRRVNPNTGTAPVFRTRRDADLTTAIYRRLPVLVDRANGQESRTWPVEYTTMFHMTNDSDLFRTRGELEEQEGAWPCGGNRFDSANGEWLPLYEGQMVQAFDHRAASIVVNRENLHRPAQPVPATRGATPRPELATRAAVLGTGRRMRLAGGHLGARVQGNHGRHQRTDVHRSANAGGRFREQGADLQTREHGPT